MGRFVSVHPLGVILAIAAGVLVAGVAGALVAVPLAAALNAVVQHLATYTDVGESGEEAAADDAPPDPVLAAESRAAEAAEGEES
jgi:predicted PurR-regulated permease PerM